MLSNKKSPSQMPLFSECERERAKSPLPSCSFAAPEYRPCYRRCSSQDRRPLLSAPRRRGVLTLHPLSSHAAGIRVRAPYALPVAVGRLADHGIVDAVAQDLLGRLDGEVARVPWSTDVLHYVLGHRLELRVVALDLGWPVLVERAPTHLRLGVVRVHPGEIIRDAAVLGEPYHRVYSLVRGLRRVQAPRVLAHRSRDVRVPSGRRRLVERHYPGEADAVVQTVVDVIVGAHRVRD